MSGGAVRVPGRTLSCARGTSSGCLECERGWPFATQREKKGTMLVKCSFFKQWRDEGGGRAVVDVDRLTAGVDI